jgi:hypothetical protein
MRSNSPLHKTEPGALAYEHSFDARLQDVSKPALAHRNDIHAERDGVDTVKVIQIHDVPR